MSTFLKWVVVLIVPTIFVGNARAAEQAIPEGTTVKLLLLRQKSVQQELELSPETIQKIMAFTNSQGDAAIKAMGQGENERKQTFEQLAKKNEKFLSENLTPKQAKRLDQIALQFTALQQLTKPEVAKELHLTDDQVKKFKDLQMEARKKLGDLLYAKEHAGKNEKLAKLREETRTKILDVLNDDQKTKVREMAGPPFKGEIVLEEPGEK